MLTCLLVSKKFSILDDPRQANVALLQNQLNDYLAVEAGLCVRPALLLCPRPLLVALLRICVN